MYKKVYLSLGSNLGDRVAHITEAIENLRELGSVDEVSSLYETEPVEFTEQPWFLNCAIGMTTEVLPKQFLAGILAIERKMGRKRTRPKGPRIIDIDVLLFGSAVVDTAELTIPHPALQERRFVLQPLAEIAATVRHPVLHRTVRELRDALPAGAPVVRRYGKAGKPELFGK